MLRQISCLGALCALMFGLAVGVRADDKKTWKLEITRELKSDKGILGSLSVNDEHLCYTLELPWKENERNVSAIPVGEYKAILRYDKKDQWRLQLDNVKDRDGIQIHIGNYTKDTKGCILVGLKRDEKEFTLSESTEAYKKLRRSFYGGDDEPKSTPKVDIKVVIKDKK